MLDSYDEILEHDSVIEVGDLRLRTIQTPGHTPGSMCFRIEGKPVLFSGDTLFPGGPGNTSLEGGDFPTIITSIEDLLFAPLSTPTPSCCPATATTPRSAPSRPSSRSGSTGDGEHPYRPTSGPRDEIRRCTPRPAARRTPRDADANIPADRLDRGSCGSCSGARQPTSARPRAAFKRADRPAGSSWRAGPGAGVRTPAMLADRRRGARRRHHEFRQFPDSTGDRGRALRCRSTRQVRVPGNGPARPRLGAAAPRRPVGEVDVLPLAPSPMATTATTATTASSESTAHGRSRLLAPARPRRPRRRWPRPRAGFQA